MAGLFASSVVALFLLLSVAVAVDYRQDDDVLDGNAARSLDSLGGGHILRGLDRNGHAPRIYRLIFGSGPKDFLRPNRGRDPLQGEWFGMAKRFDSLAGLGFGMAKRNLDEIDRSNFGHFAKRNQLDEIDRSDFDRFVRKRDTSQQQLER